jgi:6-phosphogluconolactonase
LINQAHTVAFLATGAGKAEKVVTVVEHQTGWEALPAAHVHPVDGNLLWLLDETAGQHLSNNSKV